MEERKKRLKEMLFGMGGKVEEEDPAMEQAEDDNEDKEMLFSDEGDGEEPIDMLEKRKKRLRDSLFSKE